MRLQITQRADLAVTALVLLEQSPSRLEGVDSAVALGTTAGFIPQVTAPLQRAPGVAWAIAQRRFLGTGTWRPARRNRIYPSIALKEPDSCSPTSLPM